MKNNNKKIVSLANYTLVDDTIELKINFNAEIYLQENENKACKKYD
ncbi:MAG: hypothetical protein Q4B52_06795 [Tissierellia bacterium]|nr:hypothetical protein [Tissierellia bacterium]